MMWEEGRDEAELEGGRRGRRRRKGGGKVCCICWIEEVVVVGVEGVIALKGWLVKLGGGRGRWWR